MKFDLDELDLQSLIEAIDRSGISEFSLTTADAEIRVSKTPNVANAAADGAPRAAPAPAAVSPGPEAVPDVVAVVPAAVGRPADGGPAPAVADGAAETELEIRTPLLGIFYRAPSPSDPPFVQVGDHVDPGTTVALIEAMKVFTAVPAGVSGVVTEVLGHDRELVEYDQALYRVAPDAAPVAR